MAKSLRSLVLGLALLCSLSLAASAAPRAATDSGSKVLETVMTLVRNEFLEEVTAPKLANGALDGMKLLLEEKKLPSDLFQPIPEDASRDAAAEALDKQYRMVAEKHPDLVATHALTEAAINGMLKVLDDPYTVYMNPEEYARLQEAMSGGNFGGLGIYIELDEKNSNQLTVVEPIENTPASRAGIRARDQILRIDGKSTKDITIDAAKDMLRGPVGSKTTLTVRRSGVAEPFDVTMSRENIHVSSVKADMVEQGGHKIGHIKLRMFGDKTNEELETAMRDLEAQGAEAFILDVRNNGGGYIVAALDVCSKFLPTGSRVVSVAERGTPESVYNSRPNLRTRVPLVVLVNEYSASASEITAGAIQDLKGGTLVGVKTFGKGSVQKIFPLRFPEGQISALKITTAHYLTPAGKDIHKLGIEPDVKVEMPGEKIGTPEDAQAQKAIDLLLEQLDKATARRTSSVPDAVVVASVDEQMLVLDRAFPGGGYQVLDRKLSERGEALVEQVRVKGRDGRERTFLFDVSSFLGL